MFSGFSNPKYNKGGLDMKVKILLVCLFIFLLLPGLGNAEGEQTDSKKIKFGVKLTGGINYLSGGDPNAYFNGTTEYFADLANAAGGTIDGRFDEIHWGSDFEADVLIYLTPKFAISIGSGYINGNKGQDDNKITFSWPVFDGAICTYEIKITSIPIKLGGYYFLPTSSKSRFFINGGMGYYVSKWSGTYLDNRDTLWFGNAANAKAGGFGVYGGAGFEFDISKNIAFVVEGFGRYAKIGGFKGEVESTDSTGGSTSEEGKLYYWEIQGPSDWYSVIGVYDIPPSGPGVRNVREAKVDFSGFVLRVGIRIRF